MSVSTRVRVFFVGSYLKRVQCSVVGFFVVVFNVN